MKTRSAVGVLSALSLACALVAPEMASASASAPAQADAVNVFPAPGTLTASPETQISFRGVPEGALPAPTVRGSITGLHDVGLLDHSDGQGVSLVPVEPFAAGETVTVSSALDIDGATDGSYTFTVATPVVLPEGPPSLLDELDEAQLPAGEAGAYPRLARAPAATAAAAAQAAAATDPPHYVSRPDLRPPRIQVLNASPGRGEGLLLTAPMLSGAQTDRGVMLHDDAGEVVWFRPGVEASRNDLQKISWFGRDALIFLESVGFDVADWVVLDDTYREVGRFGAGNGYVADVHDVIVTDRGTAYVMIYSPILQDLSPFGGRADAVVTEGVVQEIDLGTGAVLFEWHSLAPGNIPVTDTFFSLTNAQVDYIHLNSMAIDDDGNLLLSGRHTSSVTKVDRTTGAVIWRFGGKRSSFTFPNDAGPNFPHDARRRGDGTLSVFDNRAQLQPRYSRGARWQLDESTMTATMVQEWRHDPDLFTSIVGNNTEMPNGNSMISFGTSGTATEYRGQTPVFETDYAEPGIFTYRTYRETWHATPAEPPALAVDHSSLEVVTAWMSWNGATEVATWRLLAGSSASSLRVIGTAARTGFETSLSGPARASDTVFVAQALGAMGQVIGTSSPVSGTPFLSETLGGITLDRPASTSWAAGRLDVAVQGSNSAVFHAWADGVGANATTAPWSSWESLGGIATAGPAMAAWAPGRLDAFVRGSDGALWHKWFDGGWSSWESLGGLLTGAPSVAAWSAGRLDVFVVGSDGALWHRAFDGGWWPWESLGGLLTGAPSVAAWGPGRLDITAPGSDGAVYHLAFVIGAGWWGWEPLGGLTRAGTGTGTAAPALGRLDVTATGTDNRVWLRSWVGFWTQWAPLGGPAQSGPAASARSGRTDVFVQGPQGAVWHGVVPL